MINSISSNSQVAAVTANAPKAAATPASAAPKEDSVHLSPQAAAAAAASKDVDHDGDGK
jgi:hypothetical protein